MADLETLIKACRKEFGPCEDGTIGGDVLALANAAQDRALTAFELFKDRDEWQGRAERAEADLATRTHELLKVDEALTEAALEVTRLRTAHEDIHEALLGSHFGRAALLSTMALSPGNGQRVDGPTDTGSTEQLGDSFEASGEKNTQPITSAQIVAALETTMKTYRREDGEPMFDEFDWTGDAGSMEADARDSERPVTYVIETWRLIATEAQTIEPAAEDRAPELLPNGSPELNDGTAS